jgi:hypothetical protein
MTKYWWFVSINPNTNSISRYDVSSYIKRSITPPIENLFYIFENIDGYKHTIKEKGTENSQYIVNDYGTPDTIASIEKRITDRLIEQWKKLNSEYIEKERKNSNDNNDDSQRIKDMEMALLMGNPRMELLRKKLKFKTHAVRRKQCKCNKIAKRKVRK